MEQIETLAQVVRALQRCGLRFEGSPAAEDVARAAREQLVQTAGPGEVRPATALDVVTRCWPTLNVWTFDTEDLEDEGFERYARGLARLAGEALSGASIQEDASRPVHLVVTVGGEDRVWDWPWERYCPSSLIVEMMLHELGALPPVQAAGLVFGHVDHGQVYSAFCLPASGARALQELVGPHARLGGRAPRP